jgi:hypothetical protein
MLVTRTFKESLNQIWAHKLDYLFLFFQLLFFARLIRQTFTDSYLVVHLVITFLFVLSTGRIKKVDKLAWVLAIFCLISIMPILLFGFSAMLYGGYAIRLIIAFLIAIYFDKSFLIYFENIVFVLAFISLPLYFVQIAVPGVFSIFDIFTGQFLHYEGIGTGSSYFFIFFLNGSAHLRNSGFLSEPSLYAIVLAWASLVNLYLNNFQLSKKLLVFLGAFMTTFSVGAYIYLLLLSMLFFKHSFSQKYFQRVLTFLAILAVLFFIFRDNPIVTDNFEMMDRKILAEERHQQYYEMGKTEEGGVSRVLGAKINVNAFFKMPIGIGLIKEGHVQYGVSPLAGGSPNGLSNLIVTWGIGFVIVLFLSAKRLSEILRIHLKVLNKLHEYKSLDTIEKLLTMTIFVIPLSGYSLFNQPFMLAMILWPLLYNKEMKFILNQHV